MKAGDVGIITCGVAGGGGGVTKVLVDSDDGDG